MIAERHLADGPLYLSSPQFWQEFFIAAANVPVRRSEDAEDQGYDEANDQTYDPSSEASMNQQASPGYTDSQADHSNRSPLMRRGQAGDDSQQDDSQQDDSTDSDRYLTAAKHARASSPPKLSNTSMKALSNRDAIQIACKAFRVSEAITCSG